MQQVALPAWRGALRIHPRSPSRAAIAEVDLAAATPSRMSLSRGASCVCGASGRRAQVALYMQWCVGAGVEGKRRAVYESRIQKPFQACVGSSRTTLNHRSNLKLRSDQSFEAFKPSLFYDNKRLKRLSRTLLAVPVVGCTHWCMPPRRQLLSVACDDDGAEYHR